MVGITDTEGLTLCFQEPAGRTAGLLCRSPSTWLKAPSSFPLLCGPQWLLSAHSIFATSSHSSASWVEQSKGHMEERIGNKCKDHSAPGEKAVS